MHKVHEGLCLHCALCAWLARAVGFVPFVVSEAIVKFYYLQKKHRAKIHPVLHFTVSYFLSAFTVALFVLFAGATRTGIVAADFRILAHYLFHHLFLLLLLRLGL